MQKSSDHHELTLTSKIAWAVTVTTGVGAVATSLLPAAWAAEAFETLRFATVFYGGTGVFYLLKSRPHLLASQPSAVASQLGRSKTAAPAQLQHT
jgi:hypothetical protein